ncbi:RiPP maturation radical SAM C-methyltransferase [Nonomuraea sp. NPDC050404]|uniref:RiPP maturation radical SAM C-methyltransferase n=1 Tax=Nonomuraea sp. NPDC050404 TaxID=3155783 RepID=UPI0033CB6643
MMADRPRVLLLSLPWHALERPSLGLSLLRAALRRDGVPCEVRYLGFPLCAAIGARDYRWVENELPHLAFAGEWLFTSALYGPRPDADEQYADRVLRRAWNQPEETIDRLRGLRARCEAFVDECVASIRWDDYDVVGFTSTFEQNLASLALARRIKLLRPEITVVFGGANWEEEMGHELHARFPFVDVVCSGEADVSFPAFLRGLRDGRDGGDVPGLVVRRAGASVRTGRAAPIADLDSLPVPCFDDYLADLAGCPPAAGIPPTLLLETSRGCWWGARHHCTFCGLNGGSMAFRSKSPERVLAEIDGLVRRHDAKAVGVVDNILDMRYFTTVLPALAAAGAPVRLFYEVKANLSAAQVRLLARAGVSRIQPGVESLSDHVLALMRKGTTALQNVQLLKWCAEFGVRPEWNLLYGFPGERAEDYEQTRELVDAIGFCAPPSGLDPVRLDRFSPFHSDPAAFGLTNVRPMEVYRYLYPFPPAPLRRIAYYFDYDHADGRRPDAYVATAVEPVRAWVERGPRGSLSLVPHAEGGFVLVDAREEATVSHRLTGWRAAVYDRCDRVTAERAAIEAGTAAGAEPDEVRAFLAECHALRLMARTGDRWLALGVHRPPREL